MLSHYAVRYVMRFIHTYKDLLQGEEIQLFKDGETSPIFKLFLSSENEEWNIKYSVGDGILIPASPDTLYIHLKMNKVSWMGVSQKVLRLIEEKHEQLASVLCPIIQFPDISKVTESLYNFQSPVYTEISLGITQGLTDLQQIS